MRCLVFFFLFPLAFAFSLFLGIAAYAFALLRCQASLCHAVVPSVPKLESERPRGEALQGAFLFSQHSYVIQHMIAAILLLVLLQILRPNGYGERCDAGNDGIILMHDLHCVST